MIVKARGLLFLILALLANRVLEGCAKAATLSGAFSSLAAGPGRTTFEA